MTVKCWDDDAIRIVNGRPVRGAFVEYELCWNGKGATPQQQLDAEWLAQRCMGLQRMKHPSEGLERRDRSDLPSRREISGKGTSASWRLSSLRPETVQYIAAELEKGRKVTALARVCKCTVKAIVAVKVTLQRERELTGADAL